MVGTSRHLPPLPLVEISRIKTKSPNYPLFHTIQIPLPHTPFFFFFGTNLRPFRTKYSTTLHYTTMLSFYRIKNTTENTLNAHSESLSGVFYLALKKVEFPEKSLKRSNIFTVDIF